MNMDMNMNSPISNISVISSNTTNISTNESKSILNVLSNTLQTSASSTKKPLLQTDLNLSNSTKNMPSPLTNSINNVVTPTKSIYKETNKKHDLKNKILLPSPIITPQKNFYKKMNLELVKENDYKKEIDNTDLKNRGMGMVFMLPFHNSKNNNNNGSDLNMVSNTSKNIKPKHLKQKTVLKAKVNKARNNDCSTNNNQKVITYPMLLSGLFVRNSSTNKKLKSKKNVNKMKRENILLNTNTIIDNDSNKNILFYHNDYCNALSQLDQNYYNNYYNKLNPNLNNANHRTSSGSIFGNTFYNQNINETNHNNHDDTNNFEMLKKRRKSSHMSNSSLKNNSRSRLIPHPSQYDSDNKKMCQSCNTKNTPCWRPGWDHNLLLCNSCGLRYKKIKVFCENCKYIPLKNELGGKNGMSILKCRKCGLENHEDYD